MAENSQGQLPRAGDVKPGCPFLLQSSTDRMLSPWETLLLPYPCTHSPVTAQNSQAKHPPGTGTDRRSLGLFQSLRAELDSHRVACPQSPYKSCEVLVPPWGGGLSLLKLSSLNRPVHMVGQGTRARGPCLSQGQ